MKRLAAVKGEAHHSLSSNAEFENMQNFTSKPLPVWGERSFGKSSKRCKIIYGLK
jgi:hypothetical protein